MGMKLQIWEHGNQADKVQISIPMLQSPLNNFHTTVSSWSISITSPAEMMYEDPAHMGLQPKSPDSKEVEEVTLLMLHMCSVNHMHACDTLLEGCNTITQLPIEEITPANEDDEDKWTNPFVIHSQMPNENSWTPARPSMNAMQGKTSLIPCFRNSIISAFELDEGDTLKFGPHSGNIDFVNKYATLSGPIYEALQHVWWLPDLSCKSSLADHITKVDIAKGYNEHEAMTFARTFNHSVMTANYKPVAKKVIPISVYDPHSISAWIQAHWNQQFIPTPDGTLSDQRIDVH